MKLGTELCDVPQGFVFRFVAASVMLLFRVKHAFGKFGTLKVARRASFHSFRGFWNKIQGTNGMKYLLLETNNIIIKNMLLYYAFTVAVWQTCDFRIFSFENIKRINNCIIIGLIYFYS